MKYSYTWLKELTKTKKDPQSLATMVMLKGFELEEIIDLGKDFENFVVGEILDLRKHPNADKLQLVKVDVGGEKLEVVCGAWNIAVGDKVPVALVGAVLPPSGITVEAREVRGVKSNGMLCAEDELGLGKDHSGIIILDKNAKVGQPLAEAMGLDDVAVDFSILPNRAHDCLSHIGMAREICAMQGSALKEDSIFGQKLNIKQKGKQLSIEIKDKKLCPRYMGAVLSNITIAPSPKWMQTRLVASGMEPINNVVDITNYVMLETGNPLHAFDFENIKPSASGQDSEVNIVVRKAKAEEKLELLDGKQLELDENNLLITNGQTPLALAGIKGGKNSGISDKTNKIILESANFNAFNIRKTRQQHALNTESQARYEKSISPVLCEKAMQRAIELLSEYAGAKLQEVVDADFSNKEKQVVTLEIERVSALLGYEVKKEIISKILTDLGFSLRGKTAKSFEFEVPYWRLDIEGPEDLIEEVGRIIGYEKIEEKPFSKDVSLPRKNKEREFEWQVKDILAGLGFDEVINYSFYGQQDADIFSGVAGHLELENSLTAQHTLLRKTLLAGLMHNVSLNEKHYERFAIFELGRIYNLVQDLPKEELKISGALYDNQIPSEEIFYVLKGKLEAFLHKVTSGKDVAFKAVQKADSQAFNLPRTAVIFVGGEPIGSLGEMSQRVMKHYGIKRRFCAFELDFEKILELSQTQRIYRPLRKYPEAKRDISMFVPYKTETAEVTKVIKQTVGDLLLNIDLFDVFIDKENNRKSLAFHLAFGAEDRTLESWFVDEVFEKVVKNLQSKVQAEVRK